MKNYLGPGTSLVVSPGAAVASGSGVLVGRLFGVAAGDIAAGESGVIKVMGVFRLPKASGESWAVGDRVYWDDTAKVCTASDGAGANVLIGAAWASAAGPDATGAVRLNGAVM